MRDAAALGRRRGSDEHPLQSPSSSPVPMALEVEIDVQNPAFKGALEPLLVRVLPLFVHDAERLPRRTDISDW